MSGDATRNFMLLASVQEADDKASEVLERSDRDDVRFLASAVKELAEVVQALVSPRPGG